MRRFVGINSGYPAEYPMDYFKACAVRKQPFNAYLCWLAFKMWRKPAGEAADDLPRRASPLSMFGAGMALTLGNPKIMVFYIALLPSLIDVSETGVREWAILAAGL